MHAQNGENVSRLHSEALVFVGGEQFLIGLPTLFRGRVGGLAILAMIDKGVDGNASYELRDATDMVHVIVRDEHVINFGEAGLLGDSDDAVGIAAIVARPTCV